MNISTSGPSFLSRFRSQPSQKKLKYEDIGANTDPSDIQQVMRDIELRNQVWEQERASKLKRSAIVEFATTEALYGTMGGVLGGMTFGIPGAVLGVATGTYLAWNKTWRQNVGTVTIETDGVVRKTPYYNDPTVYQKSDQDWTFEKTV